MPEVDVSIRRRAEYSSDASNYRVVPAAVGFPRSAEEIAAAFTVCRERGVPLTLRGGGTSVAGNAVGTGLVLDVGRYLNRVLAVDPDTRTARVQPGAVLDDLQAAAAPHRLRFGPDPSTHARCTLGGMIGNNACGPHALAYGRTADNVVSLDVLAGTGELVTAAPGTSLPAVDEVVRGSLATIRAEFGRFGRQVSGYSLEHLLPERGTDLAKALVGTEGTCAIVLGATVALVEQPAATALAVLGYSDMASAADATPSLLPLSPLAVEGIDARLVDVVRARKGASAVPNLPRGDGWLFVEAGGSTPAAAADAAGRLVAAGDALDAVVVPAGPQEAALWRIREDGAGLAGRTAAGEPAWPGWEDAAVPPTALGAYLRDFDALLATYRLSGLSYGHFGDGCVHARIDFPLATAPVVFRDFLIEAARLVAGYGGSLSGEHGDGRARGELLALMYSADALRAFAGFKAALDPDNLLNPGVLVEPRPVDADLRLPAARRLDARLGFAYPRDAGDFTTAVHRCVGVGRCRAETGGALPAVTRPATSAASEGVESATGQNRSGTPLPTTRRATGSGGVMCPSYLATRDEKDSTRGRARVLQEMANGTLVGAGWRAAEVHESLDLCLSCKGCASDCPAGVDMATYKAEVLFQTYRRRLRPRAHYALGWLPRWARLASVAPGLVNAALRVPVASGLAKAAAGIDARRPLPAFAPTTFRSWYERQARPMDGRPVLLFVDTFTEYFGPQVGRAAVAVLTAAGFQVQIPDRPLCCGLTWITTGQLDGARRQLRRTLAELAPHAVAGTPIVGLEPSCTAVLRADAVELMSGDPRAAAVAVATRTLAELLDERGWSAPSLAGTTVLAQPHCHQHAVLGYTADTALLTAAGAAVSTVGGCCGLAGNFGVERGHYDVSVAIAEHALLPAVRSAAADAVILADGFSCRTQLAQLSNRRGLHLAEVLAGRLQGSRL
jgi:FAD/FMN-containing dehydrogenase/Fe-S oxidoreductase